MSAKPISVAILNRGLIPHNRVRSYSYELLNQVSGTQ